MLVFFILFTLCCFKFSEGNIKSCGDWPNHENYKLIHSDDDCGRAKNNGGVSTRIYNGSTVEPGSLPWMALLFINVGGEPYQCGGTILNDNYVITAAHCAISPNATITVSIGVHNQLAESPYVYGVEEINIYPGYSSDTGKFDLALLRLDNLISFNSPLVNYICLPTSCKLARKSYLSNKLTLAGWGKQSNGKLSETLQKIDMKGITCLPYLFNNEMQTPVKKQLCAWSHSGLPCAGDSGGPLLWYDPVDKRYFLIGVSASGPDTCTLDSETNTHTFTKVAPFIEWILKTIRP